MVLCFPAAALAQAEEDSRLDLKLDVTGVEQLNPTQPGAPSATFTAVITMTNKGDEVVGVSRTDFTFFLFDASDRPVFMLSWDRPDGPDMMPLEPNESATYEIPCRVTYYAPKAGKPYRLVVVGHENAALKTFRFDR